jgi:hypothetical protein
MLGVQLTVDTRNRNLILLNQNEWSELLGFWILPIVRYSKKKKKKNKNTMFRKLSLFPSSGEEGGTCSVESLNLVIGFTAVSKGPNRAGASFLT